MHTQILGHSRGARGVNTDSCTVCAVPSRDQQQRDATEIRRGCRTKGVLSGVFKTMTGMPQNFLSCDRDQDLLLPPSLRDWLPGDHFAWFLLDSVKALELSAFYDSYRADGHGRAAYEPSMMVGLVLYAYATNERSARGIERHCRDNVAFRVITANVVPDHATIARFLVRHEEPLAELF